MLFRNHWQVEAAPADVCFRLPGQDYTEFDQDMSRLPKVILLIESSRASGRTLLRGVADYSRHHGPWSFYWAPNGLEQARPLLKAGDADGILFRDTKATKQILGYGLPAIVVGHRQTEFPGLANVVTDSPAIGRMGAKHLAACGYRRFAYCGYAKTPMQHAVWSDIRRQFFSERIVAAGFDEPLHYELSLDARDWPRQRRSLARWVNSLPKPVGLMACNDDCGRLIMETCKLLDLAVPDEVGVLGADDDEVVCGLTDPPMSSIDIDFERAGYDAAHALDRLMQGSKSVPPRITAAASRVVARRSTDFVATQDPHLARALRIIRDHARGGLSVQQVAQAAGLSRGTLDKRFQKTLGRSIAEELARARTEQIARLLKETSLPVAHIAELFGFTDAPAFLRSLQSGKRRAATHPWNGGFASGNSGSDEAPEDGLPQWHQGVPF
jgi:LacI family transcriptional regulator